MRRARAGLAKTGISKVWTCRLIAFRQGQLPARATSVFRSSASGHCQITPGIEHPRQRQHVELASSDLLGKIYLKFSLNQFLFVLKLKTDDKFDINID
jgi:hypothetical protein